MVTCYCTLVDEQKRNQKPEVNVVIRFSFYKLSINELTKFPNYKLKRLSSGLLICGTQNKIFIGDLAVVSFISSLFEAKSKFWEPNFRCSALKCVEAQGLNLGVFFVVIARELES